MMDVRDRRGNKSFDPHACCTHYTWGLLGTPHPQACVKRNGGAQGIPGHPPTLTLIRLPTPSPRARNHAMKISIQADASMFPLYVPENQHAATWLLDEGAPAVMHASPSPSNAAVWSIEIDFFYPTVPSRETQQHFPAMWRC